MNRMGMENIMAEDSVELLRRELDKSREEIAHLRRTLNRKERSNQLLAKLNEHAERLRQVNEEDKKLQYLYNDLLLKNSPNTVLLFNENLRYMLGSENYTPLMGRNRGNLLNRPLEQVFSDRVDASWIFKIHSQCRQVLDHQDNWRYNDTIPMKGSAPLMVQVSVSPIVEASGVTRGALVSITDVSELVEAQRRAEDAARTRSDFLANMSHEIRTPMNAIVGIAEILLHDDSLKKKQRKFIHDIKLSADSLLTIINDILDISKLEAGKLALNPVPFYFRQFLDNICSLTRYLALEKALDFVIETDGVLPACLVADDDRLRQVLVNILGNAVKFTHHGSITLRLTVSDDELRFDITDTGVGIGTDEQATLFQPFKQIDPIRNRNIKGTGLGLSISKNILDLMGGSISMTSEPGRGSTFTITIPKNVGDIAEIVVADVDHDTVFDSGVRVLIVDDNEINLSVAVGLLSTLYNIDSDRAASGRQAVAKAAENEYDVIFMDHMMPEMDGVETTARIRAMGGWRAKVPIIALTANAIAGAREMLLSSNLNDFLAKPLQRSELDAVLRKWVPKRYCLGTRVINREPEPTPADPHYRGVLAKVATLPEISVEDGLESAAGDHAVYERSLTLLKDKIPGFGDMLEQLLKERNTTELSVHVHGMKSSLASVGAAPLSRQAKDLERAADAGDVTFCTDYLPLFVSQLRELGERLGVILVDNADGEPVAMQKGDPDSLIAELKRLLEALPNYDAEAIADILDPLRKLDFGPGINPLLTMLKSKIDAFDYDGARAFVLFHFPEI